jgi:hypothetical protein
MRCYLLIFFLLLFKSESVFSQKIDSFNHPLIFIYTDKAPVINTESGDIFSLEGKYSQVNLNFASQSVVNSKTPPGKIFTNDSLLIDSIYNKILTTKDTTGLENVVDYFHAKANNVSSTDFKQELYYIDHLKRLFSELKLEDHLFWIHSVYACMYQSRSLTEAAAIQVAKADSIEQRAGSKHSLFYGRGYNNLAYYYYFKADYASARMLNAQALSIAEKEAEPTARIVARIYHLNGSLFDAKVNIGFLKKSLRIYELRNDSMDKKEVNYVYLNLMNNYIYLKDSTESWYCFMQIKDRARNEIDNDFLKGMLRTASEFYALIGQSDSALAYIDKCIEICQRNNLRDNFTLSALSHKSTLLYSQNKTLAGIEICKKALNLSQFRGDIDSFIFFNIYFNLARCYLKEKEYSLALENCRLSKRFLQNVDGQDRNYSLLDYLQSQIYLGDKNYKYALQYADSALSYNKAVDPMAFVYLHLTKAQCYNSLREHKLFNEEMEILGKIIDGNIETALYKDDKIWVFSYLGRHCFFSFKLDSSLYYYNKMGADNFLPANGFMSNGYFVHDEDLFALDLIHENRFKELSILLELKDELSDIDTLVRYIYKSVHYFKSGSFNAFQQSHDELLDYYKSHVSARPIYFEYIKLYYKVMILQSLELAEGEWFTKLEISYESINDQADGSVEVFLSLYYARKDFKKEALNLISRAVKKGYTDYTFLERCIYFEQIRAEGEFQKSIAKAKLNYRHTFAATH